MKTPVKLFMSLFFSASMLMQGGLPLNAEGGKTVYYFWRRTATRAKRPMNSIKSPEGIKDGSSWTWNGIRFIPFPHRG